MFKLARHAKHLVLCGVSSAGILLGIASTAHSSEPVGTTTVARWKDNKTAVRDAMRRLGFTPRAVRPGPRPRAAGPGEGDAVAVIAAGYSKTLFGRPLYTRLLNSLIVAAQIRGVRLLIDRADGPERSLENLLHNHAAGVIAVVASEEGSRAVAELQKRMSVVCMFPLVEDVTDTDTVETDSAAVGRLAAEHLASQGAGRAVAVIGSNLRGMAMRWDGFREAARRCGVKSELWLHRNERFPGQDLPEATRIIETDYATTPNMLKALRKRGTVFLPNDYVTAKVVNSLAASGGVPAHVVSIGNMSEILQTCMVTPASIDLNLEEAAESAFDLLARRAANPSRDTVRLLAQPKLVVPRNPSSDESRGRKTGRRQ